jgi:hypothetical protein
MHMQTLAIHQYCTASMLVSHPLSVPPMCHLQVPRVCPSPSEASWQHQDLAAVLQHHPWMRHQGLGTITRTAPLRLLQRLLRKQPGLVAG